MPHGIADDQLKAIFRASSLRQLKEMLNHEKTQRLLKETAHARGLTLTQLKEDIERRVKKSIVKKKGGEAATKRAVSKGYAIMKAKIDGNDPAVMNVLRQIAAAKYNNNMDQAIDFLLASTKHAAMMQSSPAKNSRRPPSKKRDTRRKNVFLRNDGINTDTELDPDGNPVTKAMEKRRKRERKKKDRDIEYAVSILLRQASGELGAQIAGAGSGGGSDGKGQSSSEWRRKYENRGSSRNAEEKQVVASRQLPSSASTKPTTEEKRSGRKPVFRFCVCGAQAQAEAEAEAAAESDEERRRNSEGSDCADTPKANLGGGGRGHGTQTAQGQRTHPRKRGNKPATSMPKATGVTSETHPLPRAPDSFVQDPAHRLEGAESTDDQLGRPVDDALAAVAEAGESEDVSNGDTNDEVDFSSAREIHLEEEKGDTRMRRGSQSI